MDTISLFDREKDFSPLISALCGEKAPVSVSGISEPVKHLFFASVIKKCGKKAVVVCPDDKSAADTLSRLSSCGFSCIGFLPRDPALISYDCVGDDFSALRVANLYRVAKGDFDLAVVTGESLLQTTVPKDKLVSSSVTLSVGEKTDMTRLIAKLVSAGYTRTDRTEGKGQFSVRGDILDVFPPQYTAPVRTEFFGDEADSMGFFSPVTQRRTENLQKFDLIPAKEIFFSEEDIGRIKEYLAEAKDSLRPQEREKRLFIEDLFSRVSSGMGFAHDLFLPLCYKRETLFSYFGDALFIVTDGAAVRSGIEDSFSYLTTTAAEAIRENKTLPVFKNELPMDTFHDLCAGLSKKRAVILENFFAGAAPYSPAGAYSFRTREAASVFASKDLLFSSLKESLDEGYTTAVQMKNSLAAGNLEEMLKDAGIPAKKADSPFDPEDSSFVRILCGDAFPEVPSSFEMPDSRFRLFCGDGGEIRRAPKKKKVSPQERILSFSDLTAGDYVVHRSHGIGIYRGVEKMRGTDGAVKDFIKITYAGSDILYVPSSNLDSVSKYIGPKSDSGNLRLNKLGGTEWAKARARAKKSAGDIAAKLIAVYSARLGETGFAFSRDTAFQKEFEDKFPYGETESQLRAAAEIKADMEKGTPMDRLLCGDVGFGKTEVAIRGIFKCVMDGKQSAILVPTTVLAWQHYQTLLSRFRGYPVKIEMLSRFVSKKEQEKVLARIRSGETDIVVGTHRLLQKDIAFHDLGFLVVDEEQRFGVTHKERLKEFSRGVDVLTLTATPIPRTLNMALGGIRDLSILEEAPEDRLPVQTYVAEYDPGFVREAIKKELRRGGQVLYLINDVDELKARYASISREFPDTETEIAYGSLDSASLSDVWQRMYDRKISVLFCTTIIETGVDLPDANTLIIENSDRFGLSQLHQLRGRVGRSDRKAYAYFTYKKGRELTEIAAKRLEAIREYTEFGSGFKIAMRDLELRGAGDLLGADQHGHLDSVGYDLYMKLLEEAVKEKKGENTAKKTECTVDLPVSAYLPAEFIPDESDRLDIYKKIASAVSDADISDLTDELTDRFGDIPEEAANLFEVAKIKWLGEKALAEKISVRGNTAVFRFDKDAVFPAAEMTALYASRLFLSVAGKPSAELTLKKNESPGAQCRDFLTDIIKFNENNFSEERQTK